MKLLHEPADQIRIERRKHALSPLQHDDSRACARRDVRELRGNVAAAHQGYACRQSLELEEAIAGDDMLFTRDMQRHWTRAAREQNVTRLEFLPFDRDSIGSREARQPMKGVDTFLRITLLLLVRNRIGEAALERHEFAPIDARRTLDAMPAQSTRRVDRLGATDQHLFRVAAAQRASS